MIIMAKQQLILYFSYSGHTKKMADELSRQLGDVKTVEIKTKKPYPSDYNQALAVSHIEYVNQLLPNLSNETIENMDDYDQIFVGFPIWEFSIPMAVVSFLNDYDLSKKEIYLFDSYDFSNHNNGQRDLKDILGLSVKSELSIQSANTLYPAEPIAKWLKDNKLVK